MIGPQRHPLLASVTHAGTVWHADRWTLATCRGDRLCQSPADDGTIPGTGCSCGLYAAASRAQLVKLEYANPGSAGFEANPVLIGEVGFAGKVIDGSQGWRAEKGRIVRLYVPHICWRLVEPLERLYRVPVELDNTTTLPKEVT